MSHDGRAEGLLSAVRKTQAAGGSEAFFEQQLRLELYHAGVALKKARRKLSDCEDENLRLRLRLVARLLDDPRPSRRFLAADLPRFLSRRIAAVPVLQRIFLDLGIADRPTNRAVFDPEAYLAANPDVKAAGTDPLRHWLTSGQREGRRVLPKGAPSPSLSRRQLRLARTKLGRIGFDPDSYLSANPDVASAGADPVDHWLNHGQAEGRKVIPVSAARTATDRDGFFEDESDESVAERTSYTAWLDVHDAPPAELGMQRRLSGELASAPLLSVITPVYRVDADVLNDTIASVASQSYPSWELCLVVADSGDPARNAVVQDWAGRDSRIRVTTLPANLGIAGNSNAGLATAAGEWAVLLDHDDMLTPDALYELVRASNADPEADFFYSDKDMVSADGTERMRPLLKPGWSPDIMLSANYLTHVNMIRMSRLREIGGWRSETDGAQDWDLFLRAIGTGGRVHHVPRVLYRWRQVHTSVASRGSDAKPYAAEAQLRTLRDYLGTTGWTGSEPRFQGPYFRIGWSKSFRPKVSLLILSGEKPGRVPAFDWPEHVEIIPAPGTARGQGSALAAAGLEDALDALAARASGEILVIWDSGLDVVDADWLAELVLPLANPDIGAVSGAILAEDGTIDAMGEFLVDGEVRPGFRGVGPEASEVYGSPSWYTNASSVPLRLTGVRRADWQGFREATASGSGSRSDLTLGLWLTTERGKRILLNPFCKALAGAPPPVPATPARAEAASRAFSAARPNGDPYVNPSLTFADSDWLTWRFPESRASRDHNFGAEARRSARAYDTDAAEVSRSRALCAAAPAGPLRKVAWITPNFDVPFYGGVHTILRAADFMLRHHSVAPVIAVLGAKHTGGVRAAIGRAFPELARAVELHAMEDADSPLDTGEVDAAICTLWTTAFPLLRSGQTRRKFYFVQDWEPLFYPAGTISGIVEATYRFGFHAVCNTRSLARSYRELGGTADHFEPSVDTEVFRPRRQSEPEDETFRLFCYARPSTPRNCFDTLSPALHDLKQRHGDGIDIITAGSYWNPEGYGLGGVVRHLGLLPYAETGLLYRGCDAGLVAMATRHPSYLPFELMACGATVITNRNTHTEWLLRDRENCVLFELTRSDIVRAVDTVIADGPLRRQAARAGYATVRDGHQDWDRTCSGIFEIIERQCRTGLS